MDSRFDTSSWSTEDSKAGPSSKPMLNQEEETSRRSNSNQAFNFQEEDEEAEFDQEDDEEDVNEDEEEDEDELTSSSKKRRLLSPSDQPSKKKKSKGVIYISRIPPGMTPPKVRHLLEGFGDVERLYLQDGREKERKRGNEGKGGESRSRSAHYTEGWVEFSSKRVAKIVAMNLNAQPIGIIGGAGTGRKGKGSRGVKGREKSRWKDDIWTMKYLSGYKWEMLSSQLANERASHAARLRNELSQDAFEQKDYLKKVERARVEREKEEKKKKRKEKLGLNSDDLDSNFKNFNPDNGSSNREKKNFTFKQRAPILKDVRDQTQSQINTSPRESGPPEKIEGVQKRKRDGSQNFKVREMKSGNGKEELNGVLSKIF